MRHHTHYLVLGFSALALALHLGVANAKPPRVLTAVSPNGGELNAYGPREDVMRFGAEVAARQGLSTLWVQAALQRANYVADVARLIMPAPNGAAKNWASYRTRFIAPARIRSGAAFWRANENWLALAEERYGVPPEIVVGIVGVETIYGQNMGSFRVLDALATLAFDFPNGRSDRSAFFRSELENFFAMCQREGITPLEPRGSYAGAMGMPQFMPSSVNKHAVDFDGDGHIDLHGSAADVIGSVANYLARAGWQRALPTRFEVAAPAEAADRAALLGPDIVPLFSPQEFAERGARLNDAAMSIEGKLALVELLNGDAAPSYVAGTTNFYAITRYNWSSYYAMAVIELGEAVAREKLLAAR